MELKAKYVDRSDKLVIHLTCLDRMLLQCCSPLHSSGAGPDRSCPAFQWSSTKCWISDLAVSVHTIALSKDDTVRYRIFFGNGYARYETSPRRHEFSVYYDTFVARCDESGVIFGPQISGLELNQSTFNCLDSEANPVSVAASWELSR